MNAHTTLKLVTKMRVMLAQILEWLLAKEQKLRSVEKERINSLPLVRISEFEFRGINLILIEANRQGTLLEMILTGLNLSLPQPGFHHYYLRTQPIEFGSLAPQMLEDAIANEITRLGHMVPMEVQDAMMEAGLIKEGKHYSDGYEQPVRVSDIFIGPRPQVWCLNPSLIENQVAKRPHQRRLGQFSPLRFMDRFGRGTRIFLCKVA